MEGPPALLSWRKGALISQQEAGRRVGASQTAWKDWETGARTPSLEAAIRIEVLTEGLVKVEAFGLDASPALELAKLRRREAARAARAQATGAAP